VAARAMFDGEVNRRSFEPEKLRDPRLLAFMSKITVKPDAAFDKFPGAPPVRITATLLDGQQIVRQIDNLPGFPGQKATRADVERKFRSNVDARWSPERTDAVLRALWALDQADELSSLLGALTVEKTR
jgi:2-methylcitrate dehydratase